MVIAPRNERRKMNDYEIVSKILRVIYPKKSNLEKPGMDNRYIKICATCARWNKGTCSGYDMPIKTSEIYYCGKWYYADHKAVYLGYNIEPGTIPEEYKDQIPNA